MALEFEEILPYVEGEGDTGKTAREKINRNFDKIKPITNVGAEMQQLRQDVSDDLEQLHDDVEEMVDKTTSLFGYYNCSTAAATAAKTVSATGYVLTNGGNLRIKMEHSNTAASGVTLQIGSAAAKELYYNNEPVSSDNTWEDNEVVTVYYDGTYYQCSTAKSDDAGVKADGLSSGVLEFSDEDGHVPFRVEGGHVKTKYFDSSRDALTPEAAAKLAGIEAGAEVNDVEVSNTDDENLEFSDDNGHVVLKVEGGHTKTKHFDSSNIKMSNLSQEVIDSMGSSISPYMGKKVAIIGDSISTNGKYKSGNLLGNVPEVVITEDDIGVTLSAYLTAHDVSSNNPLTIGGQTFTTDNIGSEITFTPTQADVGKMVGVPATYYANEAATNPVPDVETWWEYAMRRLDFIPIPACWSGSCMTRLRDGGDYACSYAWHDSHIRKAGVRVPGTMNREAPDYIIIYRGTNDFRLNNIILLDDYFDNINYEYPANDVVNVSGGYKWSYLHAIALTISKLRAAYPLAKIFLCTMNVFRQTSDNAFPTRNSSNLLPDYNNAIRKAADFFGCGLIEFDKDGITYENASNFFIDYNQTTHLFTHPNNNGHEMMGIRAINDMLRQY